MAVEVELTELFEAAPSEVFSALTDLEKLPDWMPGVVRLEKITCGDIGLGTEFRETRIMSGRKATEHFEITHFEPNTAIELLIDGTKGSSGNGLLRFRYTLIPSGINGTELHVRGQISGLTKFGMLMSRIFRGSLKRTIAKDHAALRAYLVACRAALPR